MQEMRQFRKSFSRVTFTTDSRIGTPRLFALGARFHLHRRPEAQEIFRKVAQADAAKSLALRGLAKGRGHRGAFLEVAPQLALQLDGRRVRIARPRGNPRDLHHPVPLLVGLLFEVIEHHLLGTVQAHCAANLRTGSGKTIAKPGHPARDCFYRPPP